MMPLPSHAAFARRSSTQQHPSMALRHAGRTLETFGQRAVVAEPAAVDLVDGAARLLAAEGPDALLVGALPFDRQAPSHLVLPEQVAIVDGPAHWDGAAIRRSSGAWHVTERPARADYQRAVQHVLARLADGQESAAATKVVLARMLDVEAAADIDVHGVFSRLLAAGASDAYCVALPPGSGGVSRVLVGASPELLVERRGMVVTSVPMAGSAERHPDTRIDRDRAQALLLSAKNHAEHRLVVEFVLDTLAPHCSHIEAPDSPVLASTATMWHLATPIEGRLKSDVSSLALATALHPTPAVCGTPRDAARAIIGEFEPFDRGFFGGAVGWCDAAGDGRWMVAIRCADIVGRHARIFAGAGVVRGSDPASEAAETGAKFRTMLDALAIDDEAWPR